MTPLTRRTFLKAGAQAAALAALPRPLGARPPLVALGGPRPVPVPPITDPDVKKLALRAVEASRAAGATYADVRLTHTSREHEEQLHVGVRALVDGYWGFAASPVWTPDEMGRLGQEAVHQAKANALGKPRRLVLAPIPKVVDGHWTMPVKLDPFEISAAEIADVVKSVENYVRRYEDNHGYRRSGTQMRFQGTGWFGAVRQDKAFASTEGSYCTQRLYRSYAGCHFAVNMTSGVKESQYWLSFGPAGMGFELLHDQNLQEVVWQALDELYADVRLPRVPLEVGRYDMVLDARAVAELLDGTLGRATELDRALGYEANATGTSYLNDPAGMLGTYPAGAELLTVTANRSEPGGCATVQWDDEGVRPEEFTLVKNGVLTDFQTTRESVDWLAGAAHRPPQPERSRGCAAAPTARYAPMTHTPNLVLQPGREAQDFEGLVRTLKTGIAFKSWGKWGSVVNLDMDFQCLNGAVIGGDFYQVTNGRRVAKLELKTERTMLFEGGGLLFRAPELWKGLLALGGPASLERYGFGVVKGEPEQGTYHSVTAPPALFKQLTLIDPSRKA